MTDAEQRFAGAAIRRRRLFLALSIVGVAVALALAIFYAVKRWHEPAYPIGIRFALVVLILLNARQNLRQYRYATLLGELLAEDRRGGQAR